MERALNSIEIEKCESSDGESQTVQRSDQNCEEEEEAPAENAVHIHDSESFENSEIKEDMDNSDKKEDTNNSETQEPIDNFGTKEDINVSEIAEDMDDSEKEEDINGPEIEEDMDDSEKEEDINAPEIKEDMDDSEKEEDINVPEIEEDIDDSEKEEDINVPEIEEDDEDINDSEIEEDTNNSENNDDTNNSETREEINDSEKEHPIDSSETEEEPQFCKPWSIFRVPALLRKLDERAYKPKIVSIGPVHRKKLGLESMEAQKLRFYDRLLKRIREQNPWLSLETAMKEMEEETRNCYSHRFDYIKSDVFIRMMVLDGCFIVELLRFYDKRHKGQEVGEPIFETRWMLPNIRRDLLLLENQLPMSVLGKLFDLTNFADEATSLNELVFRFFEPLRPGKDKLPNEKLDVDRKYPHLLALFQSSFVPSNYRPSPKRGGWNKYDLVPGKAWVNNASTLMYAGVRFRNKSGGLIEIESKNNVLEIPTLFIDNGIMAVLRNILAYEQCTRSAAPYFTCLAVFFGSVVRTPQDVNIFQRRSIISLGPGRDKEVVHLLNNLSKELKLDMDNCPITELIEDLNHACRSSWAQIKIHTCRLLCETDFSRLLGNIISSITLTVFVNAIFQLANFRNTTSASPSFSPSPSPSPSPS